MIFFKKQLKNKKLMTFLKKQVKNKIFIENFLKETI